MSNRFVVSVANAIGRYPDTKQGIFYGKANLSSAFTLSMQETEVRGGINNALLYTYKHTRELAVTIEQVIASQSFLALNTGSQVRSGVNQKILATDCITLDGSGKGTLKHTPVGTAPSDFTIFLPDGRIAVPDSVTGTSLTYVDGAGLKLDVIYEYMGSADLLTIETTTPPDIIDLTLIAEIRDNKKGLIEYQHINIPSFQVDGNYELSFNADGVSQESLSGKALKVEGETCEDGDVYAYVKWVPVAEAQKTRHINEIVTTPSSPVVKAGATVQLVTKGLYGGVIAPTRLSSDLAYVVKPTGKFTVDTSGLLKGETGVTSADEATIEITYTDKSNGNKEFKDYVFVKGATA